MTCVTSCSRMETSLPRANQNCMGEHDTAWAAGVKGITETCGLVTLLSRDDCRISLPGSMMKQHELFRNSVSFRAGAGHLRAEEIAGDCAPGRENAQRIPAGFERIQIADRAGDRAPGSGKYAEDGARAQPNARRYREPEFAHRKRG